MPRDATATLSSLAAAVALLATLSAPSIGQEAPATTSGGHPAAPSRAENPESDAKSPRDKTPRRVPASEVTEKARSFASACKCLVCKGEGKVIHEKVQRSPRAAPPRNKGAVFHETEKKTWKAQCDSCKGTGLAAEPIIMRAGVNLLRAIELADPADPKTPERFEAALEHVSKATKATRGWTQRINTPALQRITGMNPKKGEYILLVGRISGVRDTASGREHTLKFGELKSATLPSAKLYKAVQDQVVLVGGRLKEVWLRDGSLDIEIEGGFVVEAAQPENEEF